MHEYSLIYMHANGTGAGVAVQFACISPIVPVLWIARYFPSLICTGLEAAKAAQSFSESSPELLSISLWPGNVTVTPAPPSPSLLSEPECPLFVHFSNF